MSFHEQNLEAFIELLTDKRSRLFSPQDRAELQQLIAPIPDDLEKLSIAIAAWYEKRPKICEAQLELLNNNQPSGDRLPGSTGGNVKPPDYKLNKQTLQNAIQQSSASGKTQS